jgi:hypothetical protein
MRRGLIARTSVSAIITLPASPLMAQIHNAKKREPAMLTRWSASRRQVVDLEEIIGSGGRI